MTRKSKRELERALEDVDDVEEPLTLCELLSYDLETVDAERGIVRVVETGEYRQVRSVDDAALEHIIREASSHGNPLGGESGESS